MSSVTDATAGRERPGAGAASTAAGSTAVIRQGMASPSEGQCSQGAGASATVIAIAQGTATKCSAPIRARASCGCGCGKRITDLTILRQGRNGNVRVYRIAAILGVLTLLSPAWCVAGALPGWRDSPVRNRLIAFVTEVSTPGGSSYVTPADRVAVFDDDGTLWPEQPRMQGMFALQRLRQVAGDHPEWQTQLPYKAALELGSKYLQVASDEAVFQLIAAAHAGQTQDAFRQDVREYFATARHPRFDQPYRQLAYSPMRDLLTYLRANGFRVFITTSGSIELVRILA
jgi:hypothetical protein